MISLAQYLPELDADADADAPARHAPSKRDDREEMTFEPLTLVAANQQAAPAAKARTSPLSELNDENEPDIGLSGLNSPAQFGAGDDDDALASAGMLGSDVDFGEAGVDSPVNGLPDFGDMSATAFDPGTAPSDLDASGLSETGIDPLEAAREAGVQQGRAEAEAEGEAALNAVREAAEAERVAAVEAARGEWAAEEGEQIGAFLSDRLDRIETIVRASLSSVLKPIALDARRRQTVLELADAVHMLIGDGQALSIRVSGPADLLEALEEALGKRKAFIVCEPDPDMVEVRIECDQTVVETRLMGWRTALEEALA